MSEKTYRLIAQADDWREQLERGFWVGFGGCFGVMTAIGICKLLAALKEALF